LSVASIHGNKSQNQRDRALSLFKNGKVKTLVATDVAARGIDIPDVSFVYNFDLPNVPENYIHRIGRTARAGKSGTAITLCASDEMAMLKGIEKLMKQEISVESGIRWIVSTEKGSKSKKPEGKKTFKKNFKRSGPKRNKSQSSRKKTQ
jgi:ATP-dependent RNA helicase RhlE